MTDYKIGDRVRVAANANDVHFDGSIIGTVTKDVPSESGFQPYIDEGRIEVTADGDKDQWVLDQWVRPEDLTLTAAKRSLSDKEALDKIAKLVEPYEGEWSDMSGILESIGNTVEATGREVIWE